MAPALRAGNLPAVRLGTSPRRLTARMLERAQMAEGRHWPLGPPPFVRLLLLNQAPGDTVRVFVTPHSQGIAKCRKSGRNKPPQSVGGTAGRR